MCLMIFDDVLISCYQGFKAKRYSMLRGRIANPESLAPFVWMLSSASDQDLS